MNNQQDLIDALENLQKEIRAHYKMNVKKDYSLMVADAQASKVLHNIRTSTEAAQLEAV